MDKLCAVLFLQTPIIIEPNCSVLFLLVLTSGGTEFMIPLYRRENALISSSKREMLCANAVLPDIKGSSHLPLGSAVLPFRDAREAQVERYRINGVCIFYTHTRVINEADSLQGSPLPDFNNNGLRRRGSKLGTRVESTADRPKDCGSWCIIDGFCPSRENTVVLRLANGSYMRSFQ